MESQPILANKIHFAERADDCEQTPGCSAVSAAKLYNPDFWKQFFDSIPAGSDREYEMLAEVAAAHSVSYAFARQCVRDYVEGRLVKQPTGCEMNPYAPNPYHHRGNKTVH